MTRAADLRARVVPLAAVSEQLRQQMFALFEKYYQNVSQEEFRRDLASKNAVILVFDKRSATLRGFSTIRDLELRDAEKGTPFYVLFSGDTVVEKEYWGQTALNRAFVRYLWSQKLRRPGRACYWFLITKGYKTYLLMANNFPRCYPHPAHPTPPREQARLMQVARLLYPDSYREDSGLIVHAGPADAHCALRMHVAPIDEALLRGNPKVAFFVEKNPDWQSGSELACLAEMTYFMPAAFLYKVLRKEFSYFFS